MRCVGLVVAAGMSSRMGRFKPLLDIGGQPMIMATINSLRHAGIKDIIVVLGNQGEALEKVLLPLGIKVVYNKSYQNSDMFHSVRLGLEVALEYDGVVFLPVDVPAIQSSTIEYLVEQFKGNHHAIVYPFYEGKRWHPPIIPRWAYGTVLAYEGNQGLRGALAQLEEHAIDVAVADLGCTLDADYPKDYQEINEYLFNRERPNYRICEGIWTLAGTPIEVINHCKAVAAKGVSLGQGLNSHGMQLDLALIESSALLHDVLRTRRDHASAGAEFLQQMGYDRVAEIVRYHMELPQDCLITINEATIVYLADKLIQGTVEVSLVQRARNGLNKYRNSKFNGQDVLRRIRHAQIIEEQVLAIIGNEEKSNVN